MVDPQYTDIKNTYFKSLSGITTVPTAQRFLSLTWCRSLIGRHRLVSSKDGRSHDTIGPPNIRQILLRDKIKHHTPDFLHLEFLVRIFIMILYQEDKNNRLLEEALVITILC